MDTGVRAWKGLKGEPMRNGSPWSRGYVKVTLERLVDWCVKTMVLNQ